MLLGFPTWAPNGVKYATCCSFFLSLLSVLLWRIIFFSLMTFTTYRFLYKGLVWWDKDTLFFLTVPFWFSLALKSPAAYTFAQSRVHFIWSSAFTIFFSMVCGLPHISFSIYLGDSFKFLWVACIPLQQRFYKTTDLKWQHFLFQRSRGTKSTNKSAPCMTLILLQREK